MKLGITVTLLSKDVIVIDVLLKWRYQKELQSDLINPNQFADSIFMQITTHFQTDKSARSTSKEMQTTAKFSKELHFCTLWKGIFKKPNYS